MKHVRIVRLTWRNLSEKSDLGVEICRKSQICLFKADSTSLNVWSCILHRPGCTIPYRTIQNRCWSRYCSPLLLPRCPRWDGLAPVILPGLPASPPPIFKLLNWINGGPMKTAYAMWSPTQHLHTLLYTRSIINIIVFEWWVNKYYLLTYLLSSSLYVGIWR